MRAVHLVTFALLFAFLFSGCSRRATTGRVDYSSTNKTAQVVKNEAGEAATLSCSIGMVLIPTGQFLYGPVEERGAAAGAKEERINMKAFCIDKYEWPNQAGEAPLRSVTYVEAANFCGGKGKRLCSEFEFEKACRGPNGTAYAYGDGFVDKGCAAAGDDYGLGQFTACVSGFGVADMSGGVYEWTASAAVNTAAGEEPKERIIRGGMSAASTEKTARCMYRVRYGVAASSREVGFRCCANPERDAIK